MGIKKIVPQFPNHGFFLLSVPDGGGQLRLHPVKGRFLFSADQFCFRAEAEGRIGNEESVSYVLHHELDICRQIGDKKLVRIGYINVHDVSDHIGRHGCVQPYLVHRSLEFAAGESVHGEQYLLPLADAADVRLVHSGPNFQLGKVCGDVKQAGGAHAGNHCLAYVDQAFDHDAVHGGLDGGVFQVAHFLFQRGFRLFQGGFRFLQGGFRHGYVGAGGFFIRNILVVAGFGQGIPRPQLFRAFPVQSGLLVLGFGLLDVRLGAGDSGNGLRFGGFRPLNVQLHGKLVDFREHLTGFYRAGIIHHLAVQVLAELHDDSADLGAYIYQFIRLRDAGCFDGDHQVSFFKWFCLVVHLDGFISFPLFPGKPDASENGNDDDEFDESLHDYIILRNNEKVARMLKTFPQRSMILS